MLILFDLPKGNIHAFNTYGTLYKYLENFEKIKGKGKWIFVQHSRQRMMSCYRYIRDRKVYAQSAETFEQNVKEVLKQAVAEKIGGVKAGNQSKGSENFDVLEIIRGNVQKPVFIPVTPDVDIVALQQKWCQDYCNVHGYALFEVSSPTDFKQIGGQDD